MTDKNSIFRKQSVDSVSSPEQLNDYIKTSNPSVWILLGAIIILLCGVCVWGIFGRLNTVATVGAVSADSQLTLYIPESYEGKIKAGTAVKVGGSEFTIHHITASPVQLGSGTDAYALHASNLAQGDFAFIATADSTLSDGSYDADVIIDSVTPMSFITN